METVYTDRDREQASVLIQNPGFDNLHLGNHQEHAVKMVYGQDFRGGIKIGFGRVLLSIKWMAMGDPAKPQTLRNPEIIDCMLYGLRAGDITKISCAGSMIEEKILYKIACVAGEYSAAFSRIHAKGPLDCVKDCFINLHHVWGTFHCKRTFPSFLLIRVTLLLKELQVNSLRYNYRKGITNVGKGVRKIGEYNFRPIYGTILMK